MVLEHHLRCDLNISKIYQSTQNTFSPLETSSILRQNIVLERHICIDLLCINLSMCAVELRSMVSYPIAESALREDYHEKHGVFGCREYTIETNEKVSSQDIF